MKSIRDYKNPFADLLAALAAVDLSGVKAPSGTFGRGYRIIGKAPDQVRRLYALVQVAEGDVKQANHEMMLAILKHTEPRTGVCSMPPEEIEACQNMVKALEARCRLLHGITSEALRACCPESVQLDPEAQPLIGRSWQIGIKRGPEEGLIESFLRNGPLGLLFGPFFDRPEPAARSEQAPASEAVAQDDLSDPKPKPGEEESDPDDDGEDEHASDDEGDPEKGPPAEPHPASPGGDLVEVPQVDDSKAESAAANGTTG